MYSEAQVRPRAAAQVEFDEAVRQDRDPALAEWFRGAWAKTGKRLDMGKSCVRFKRLDDLALDVIAEAVRRAPSAAYVACYQATLARAKQPSARKKQ